MAINLQAILTLRDKFTSRLQSATRQIQQTEQRTQQLNNQVSQLTGAFAALGVAAGGGLAMANFIGQEQSLDRIAAKTTLVGAELKNVENAALSVYKNGFGESLGAVVDDITTVKSQLSNLTAGGIDNFARGALMIQELWGEEVNATTAAVKTLLSNFEGLNEIEALDGIAWGFKNGLNFSNEFLDTLREYAPQFQQMGMSFGQMLNVLKAGSDAGAWNLDKVGDAIKESHLRMGALDTATVDAYKSMGLNADEYVAKISKGGEVGNKAFQEIVGKLMKVKDETKRNALATDLFGTQFEDLQEKVIFAMAGASGAAADFGGTMRSVIKDAHSNLSTKLTVAWRYLDITIGQLVTKLYDKVEPAFGKIAEIARQLAPAFAPIGKVLAVFAGSILGILAFGAALKGIAFVIGFLTSPIALVAAGITGLVYAFKYAYENSEGFKNAIDGVVGKVKELFAIVSGDGSASSKFAGILSALGLSPESVATAVAKLQEIKTTVSAFFTEIKTAVGAAMNGDASGLLGMLGISPETAAALMEYFTTIKTAVTEVVTYLMTKLAEMKPGFMSLVETLKAAFSVVQQVIVDVVAYAQPAINALVTAFKIVADAATLVFNNVLAPGIALAISLFRMLWSVVGPIMSVVGAAISVGFGVLKVVWETILKPFATFITGVFKAALESAKPVIDALGDAFSWVGDKISAVADIFKGFANKVSSFKLPSWVTEAGGKVMNFITGGGGKALPSHYHGINRVPYDGYQATLHKGERVLTKKEVERGAGSNGGNTYKFGDIVLQGTGYAEKDVDNILAAIVRKIDAAGGAGA